MRKGIGGAYGRPEPFKGTHAYFSMQSTYLLIFISRKLSNLERVRNAAFVVGILRRWRCFVKRNKELTLKLNFFFQVEFCSVSDIFTCFGVMPSGSSSDKGRGAFKSSPCNLP